MTKIIFLDIDGPMIPYRCMCLPGQTVPWTLFDPVAVSLINDLCAKNGFKVVLHTSWVRIMGGQQTKDHCISQGINPDHFHSDAYCDENISWRYTRVAEWLSRHPEVESYVILDDDPYQADLNFPIQHQEGMALRVILVNYYTGFLFHEYNEVLAKLKDDPDENSE